MNSDAEFDPASVPIRPAATVIVLRDSDAGMEVLVLRRDTALAFHGGSWVFPGGRLDPEDFERSGSAEPALAARHAAVREAREEAALEIEPDDLVSLSHWTTPLGRNRRFATWFFVTRAPDGDVVVDDGEIREFEWHTIDRAIEGCQAGEIMLAGPTYVSLLRLAPHRTVDEALRATGDRPDEVFVPRLVTTSQGTWSVYGDDPAYESGDLELVGPRHRMEMRAGGGYGYVNELDQLRP